MSPKAELLLDLMSWLTVLSLIAAIFVEAFR